MAITTKQSTKVLKAKNVQDLWNLVGLGGQRGGSSASSGSSSSGTPAPSSTPSTGTETAPAPSGPSANLQALLAAIPIAMDGQVITSDHHNSLRAALLAIASQLGLGLTSPTTNFTFAPGILPIAGAPANWPVNAGNAAVSAAGANPDGWLPVQLPDGANIQSMTVTGKLTPPAPASFQVVLFRESVAPDPNSPAAPLISLALQSQSGVFSVSGSIVPGAATSASGLVAQLALVQDLKLIDNSSYKYFLRATVTGAGGATVAEIDAIQIAVGS